MGYRTHQILQLTCIALIICTFCFFGCGKTEPTEPDHTNHLFEVVSHVPFPELHWGEVPKGYIIRDKITGIKYLYVWAGYGQRGGPAITRYYEKEEIENGNTDTD